MRDSAKERGENEGNRGKDGKIWLKWKEEIDGVKTRRKDRECGKTGGRMKV